MRKKVGIIKRVLCIGLIFLLSINSFAAIVSDNDGSAFITKAEFDALKSSFQGQIDTYNQSIDSKIDGAIASYLAGIKLSTTEEIVPQVPVNEKIISTTGNDYGWKEGNLSFSLTLTTGPYGDMSDNYYCVIGICKIENKDAPADFDEISIEYDETNMTGIYGSHNKVQQVIVGTCDKTSCGGYSTVAGESSPYYYFTGWRRLNPDQDVGDNLRYAGFNRDARKTPQVSGSVCSFTGNRHGSLGRGVNKQTSNMPEFCTVSFTRNVKSSKKRYIVVPNSSSPVFGFYTSVRTKGFCNDSVNNNLDLYNNNIGTHTIMDPTSWFKNTTMHLQYKKHTEHDWTIASPLPDLPFALDAGLTTKPSSWDLFTNGVPSTDFITGTIKTCAESHNANIGYYHKPYLGCENLKTWNKIGYDYGSDTNTKIRGANNHGTLVDVNGSKYLSPVSGIPIFVATADGTAEVEIKFEKDADHMPDTNSTYADLYISNQPFKENNLGYNNAVIGPKSGSTARKLLSDQPAGHGTGSIKVDYGTVTNLKFEVQKDEPIFINFSAYEPSQSSYRGKCTATLQSNILLTKAN